MALFTSNCGLMNENPHTDTSIKVSTVLQVVVQPCRVSQLMFAIRLAVPCKSTRHVFVGRNMAHKASSWFLSFIFCHRSTYNSSAVIFLLYSSVLPISVNIGLIISFFHFHIFSQNLECTCGITSGYIQSIMTNLNELQPFYFLDPFSC